MKKLFLGLGMCCTLTINAQTKPNFVRENYTKIDTNIVMRDGIKLKTIIYIPKDETEKYPFLIERTPYSSAPYGDSIFAGRIGPNTNLMREKYIFVYQDVRGRYMSEGINLEVTPYIENKKTNKDVDENSDTYDAVEWLVKNIKNNNGRAGLYGISYPGFYATASLPNAHPAIKAVSPQAPVTDEFIGDDANHNGAFFLLDNFSFMNYYGKERNGPVADYGAQMFEYKSKDAYDFFLKLGPIKNTQSAKYFNNRSAIWNEYLQHDTYDDYWKARNIRPHLQYIKPAVMVVGGWFDAEDLYGALNTYMAIEKQNKINKNYLVMGPWTHGAWAGGNWNKFTTHDFGANTNKYYQDSLETLFFNFYLKDKGTFNAAEATVFETGTNQWKSYNVWPPKEVVATNFFLQAGKLLSTKKGRATKEFDEYVSDPANPVPYTKAAQGERNNGYMGEDQRFASERNDVLYYVSDTLKEDITLAGKIIADLEVSLSATDADFVVKLIDVLPANEPTPATAAKGTVMAGLQRLVRAEVFRGKFRESFITPKPFVPNKITNVKFDLNDVAHTFKKGHKIMVQIQSSWFPLVDRNPQKFMRIPDATESDFQKATIHIYHNSKIVLPVLSK
ncbi:MAG: CocE/NonD family hydrolase [Ferruginibacter sp.]